MSERDNSKDTKGSKRRIKKEFASVFNISPITISNEEERFNDANESQASEDYEPVEKKPKLEPYTSTPEEQETVTLIDLNRGLNVVIQYFDDMIKNDSQSSVLSRLSVIEEESTQERDDRQQDSKSEDN